MEAAIITMNSRYERDSAMSNQSDNPSIYIQ